MLAQLRPISTITFASAFLAAGLGVGVPARIAFAVECLAAPNSTAPSNSHWYYRTDRAQQRKCWHLQTENGPPEQGAAPTAREAPVKPSQTVAADFVAQRGGAKLSDEDVDKLYAEFLEWKRHAKN
jgi:hypothetical protein